MALSILFMGLGQFYNKEYLKGIIYFLIEVVTIIFIPYFKKSIYGLITLGDTPLHYVDGIAQGDHSIFLLVDGLIAALLLTLVVIVYILNIIDAKNLES